MTNYARIVDGVAVDVSTAPANCFHPLLAVEFVEVPGEVAHGWRLDGDAWQAPTGGGPVIPEVPPQVGHLSPTPPEFLLLLTLSERVAIRAAGPTDVVVEDILKMVDDPRVTFIDLTNPSVIEAVNYLSTTEPPLLTSERAAQILSGMFQ